MDAFHTHTGVGIPLRRTNEEPEEANVVSGKGQA